MTEITVIPLASSVPSAGLAYLLHVLFSSFAYCKHYANGPPGTDLASIFFAIIVTGIT
jgi:hypothetical protein